MKLIDALNGSRGLLATAAASAVLVAGFAPAVPAKRSLPSSVSAAKRAPSGSVLRTIDRKTDTPGPRFLAAGGPAYAASKADQSGRDLKGRILDPLADKEPLFVRYSELTGMPRLVYGDLGEAPAAAEPDERAKIFLQEESETFGVDVADLETMRAFETPGGSRAYFQQRYQGLPVFYGEVAVHISKRGRVRAVTNTFSEVAPKSTEPEISPDQALGTALEAVGMTGPALIYEFLQPSELGIWPTSDGGRLAWRVTVPSRDPVGLWEVVVDARSGAVIEEPVNRLCAAQGSGAVFQPNPIVSEGNNTLLDENDSKAAVPNSAYKSVTLTGLDGSGMLVGTFSRVHPSMVDPAIRANGSFTDLDRSNKQFNEVQVYWSIQKAQEVFTEIGYGSNSTHPVMNFAIRVYPHDSPTWGDGDNSSFSPSNIDGPGTGILEFGTGGVDDAEDAEIVWHEYGHAILHHQRPGIAQNQRCEGLGEGWGDYFAYTMSRRVNGDARYFPTIGEWDATSYSSSPIPYLRRIDEPQLYPNTEEEGHCTVHTAGQTWSRALYEFEGLVGADVALRTALEANFLLDLNPTQVEAANAMLQADESLTGGVNQAALMSVFTARGILQGELKPVITKVTFKKSSKGTRLLVEGSGFKTGSAVIEVNGVALGAMKYPSKFVTGGFSGRIVSKDAALKTVLPRGATVTITVFNLGTSERSAPFTYTRPSSLSETASSTASGELQHLPGGMSPAESARR